MRIFYLTEGAFLAARGIPTLPALGPGLSTLAHGPDEWVSIASLRRFRQALADFVTLLPGWLERERGGRDGLTDLHAVEGGLA